MKLWAGRFSKEVDDSVNDFNSSIAFDARMYPQDIRGSVAHAEMLAASGIISADDAQQIKAGLLAIQADIESGALAFDPAAEDIHMFLEAELTLRIGEAGKRLHTGRSRNDQVAVDIRMHLQEAVSAIITQIDALIQVLCDQAGEHTETVMPGYTHLQRAQPIVFGHHLMAYAWMLLRDRDRLQDAAKRMMRYCPLGSGALAGTTYPLDRFMTATALGFDEPCPNSLDGVSDRDFCIEIASALSILMMHLSRFSEEIISWCSWEWRFVELDDAWSTGSSIMPQKKNPDVAELIRGKTGRVYGDLMTLLSMMKSLPLAYNKDMQEDKEAIFDCVDTVTMCLTCLAPMVQTMQVRTDNMRAAAARGFINATDCADYLTRKGMAFRDAYKITGELVAQCIAESKTLETLSLADYQAKSDLFENDIYAAINLETCARSRTSYGGPAPESVRRQIDQVRGILKTESGKE